MAGRRTPGGRFVLDRVTVRVGNRTVDLDVEEAVLIRHADPLPSWQVQGRLGAPFPGEHLAECEVELTTDRGTRLRGRVIVTTWPTLLAGPFSFQGTGPLVPLGEANDVW